MLTFGGAQLKGIELVILKRTILFAPVEVENVVFEEGGGPGSGHDPAELDGAENQLYVAFH